MSLLDLTLHLLSLHWEYHKGAYDEMVAHLDQIQWGLLFEEDIDQNYKIFIKIYYYRLEKRLFPTVQQMQTK